MGSSLSGSFGYGIVLPNGDDDDDYDYEPNEFVEGFRDGESIDWYEVAEALTEEFGLTYDTSYVYDYSGGTVLFSSVVSGYDLVNTFDTPPAEPGPFEKLALLHAAMKVGIPFEPAWLLVLSYG